MNNNDWTDILRHKLAEHTETPPEALWEGIEDALELRNPEPSKPRRFEASKSRNLEAPKPRTLEPSNFRNSRPASPRRALRLWISAAAACALLLAGIAVVWNQGTPVIVAELTNAALPTAGNAENPTAENASASSSLQPNAASASSSFQPNAPKALLASLKTVSSPESAAEATSHPSEEAEQQESAPEPDETAKPAAEPDHSAKPADEPDNIQQSAPNQTTPLPRKPAEATKANNNPENRGATIKRNSKTLVKRESPLSLNLYAANISSIGIGSNGDELYYVSSSADPSNGDFTNTYPPLIYTPDELEQPANQIESVKHRRPVRIGLSLSCPLNERLSINVGLTFARLSSEVTYSKNGNTVEHKQTNVGLPIGVTYSLLAYKPLALYLTGGGMIEQCIFGEETRPQLSLFSGMGLQLNLSSAVSVFAEPLATYNIDNHSPAINVYKDRTLDFDFRLGLRVGF